MKTAFSSKSAPITAEWVKLLRATFGEGCRVLAVSEGEVRHDPEGRLDANTSPKPD